MGPTTIKQHMVTVYPHPFNIPSPPLHRPHLKSVNAVYVQLYNLYEITSTFIVQFMKMTSNISIKTLKII